MAERYYKFLATRVHHSQLEQIIQLVRKFATPSVDIARWWVAAELTANRAGFILSNDLDVAAKMVSIEPASIGSLTAKDKVKDLVLYSISEDYFRVRKHLGMTIGQ